MQSKIFVPDKEYGYGSRPPFPCNLYSVLNICCREPEKDGDGWEKSDLKKFCERWLADAIRDAEEEL